MSKYVPLELTDEHTEKLDSEHDDVFVCRGKAKSPWVAAFRRPTFDEVRFYKAMLAKPEQRGDANVKLLKALCVFPEGKSPEWKAQFERWPFFPDGVADSEGFKDFIGLSIEESEK